MLNLLEDRLLHQIHLLLYLEDMLEHAEYAVEFISGKSQEDFANDRVLQFALVRALEVVGEAAKGIPEQVRALATNVPWRQITGMRDKLIHRYFGVDAAIVWATVTDDMPKLIEDLGQLIDYLRSENGQ